MYLEKNLEKKWLIKSENKVLGPYNFDQVIDLIRKKQISLIDEIRDPEVRWLYVRENPEFKAVVEEMRKEIDNRQESTKTYQSVSKTIDESLLKTKTDIQHQFTDINLETKDVTVVKEEITVTPVAEYVPPQKMQKAKLYGVQTDEVVQKKMVGFSVRVVWLSAIMGLIVLGAFFGNMYYQKRNLAKQADELETQVRNYFREGLYERVLEAYPKLLPTSQKKIVPYLLEIYPMLEKNSLGSTEELKAIKTDVTLGLEQRGNVDLVNFYHAMEEKNYGQASDFLTVARASLPASLLIKENEAILSLKIDSKVDAKLDVTKKRAYDTFQILHTSEASGRYLFGMVQAYYGMTAGARQPLTKSLLTSIQSYTSNHYDYRKELLLAQIQLAQELKEDVAYKSALKLFFNTPVRLSEEFRKPNLIAPNSYQWSDLSEIKAQVQKTLTGDDLLLFELHDYLEQEQNAQATEFLKNNSARVANQQVKEQMNLLLLIALQNYREAVAAEKVAHLDMNSELNHFLLAKAKSELDLDIATHMQFFTTKEQNLYKCWFELEKMVKKKSPDIKKFIKDNFITTPNFAPIFKAKNQIFE